MTRKRFAPTVLLAALAGCSSQAQTVCETIQDCVGGNEADTDACVADLEGQEGVASAYDCDDQFDAFIDCVEDTGSCVDGAFASDCNAQAMAVEACQTAGSDLGS